MTKNNKLLLEDYLRDKTDLRLSLFANSINAAFKMDKKSKEQLRLLIADYELNKLPARLKIIESFVGVTKEVSKARIKPSELKSQTLSREQIEAPKKNSELEMLYRKAATYRQSKNFDLNEEYVKCLNRIKELEIEAGLYDVKPPEHSQLSLVLGILGHWDDPNSIAHELIHGQKSRIVIESGVQIRDLIKWLGELSGQNTRQFYVQSNEMSGSLQQGNKQPIYTLTDARYGAPAKNNFVVMLDGQINNDLPISKMIQSPNMSQAGWAKE